MGELDLKDHFLKKLFELRYMKEEYYGAPEERDAFEVIAERQQKQLDALKRRKRRSPARSKAIKTTNKTV